MDAEKFQRLEFADALLSALGLPSITTQPDASGSDDMTRTGIYGQSHYSATNREVILRVFEQGSGPKTVRDLAKRLSDLVAVDDIPEVRAVLEATNGLVAEHGDEELEHFVRKS